MTAYTDKIKEIAKRLLNEGKVDMIIGFRKGTIPMMNEPCFVTTSSGCARTGMGQQLRHQPGQLPDQSERKR